MQLITLSKEANFQGLQWIFISRNGKAAKFLIFGLDVTDMSRKDHFDVKNLYFFELVIFTLKSLNVRPRACNHSMRVFRTRTKNKKLNCI